MWFLKVTIGMICVYALIFSIARPVYADFSDLGCNVITDTLSHPHVDQAKPEYLSSYIDSTFGSKVTRVSGDPGTRIFPNDNTDTRNWPAICRHHYSKDQAWNADQTILWLNKGCKVFLDGNTYQPIKLQWPSATDYRWHPTDPDIIIYIKDNKLAKWNVRTSHDTTIRLFSGYSSLTFGLSEGNMSRNGQRIALYSTASKTAFVYDMSLDIKFPDIPLTNLYDVDWVSVSALENYVVVNGDLSSSLTDRAFIYDLNGVQVGETWSTYGCPSHYDLTVDANGEEVAVGVCKTGTRAIIKRNLRDGVISAIAPQASHTSTRNLLRPNFAYASKPYYAPFLNEILAFKLDGSVTERLGYIPNVVSQYEAEPHGSPSLDGKRIVLASNWGDSSGPIQSYVVEACPGVPISSPTPTPTSAPTPTMNIIPGDANGDNRVDGLDYIIWLTHYGQNVSGATNGDFNTNGTVDGLDYVIWLNNYGG